MPPVHPTVSPFIATLSSADLQAILYDLLNREVEQQITCVSILIDIYKSPTDENMYIQYLNKHSIKTSDDLIQRLLEDCFLTNSLCCSNYDKGNHRYTRFMRYAKFESLCRPEPNTPRNKYAISPFKIGNTGWSGNFKTTKSECIWITQTDEYELTLSSQKSINKAWELNPYFEANFAWDYCGLRRYPENLFAPIDGQIEEAVRVDYPDSFDRHAKVYQPNSTVGYFLPLSFYISAPSVPNNYFGLTFCPYNPSLNGRERVHKNHHSIDGFTAKSIGHIRYDIPVDKNDKAEVMAQMQLILAEAVRRLI